MLLRGFSLLISPFQGLWNVAARVFIVDSAPSGLVKCCCAGFLLITPLQGLWNVAARGFLLITPLQGWRNVAARVFISPKGA